MLRSPQNPVGLVAESKQGRLQRMVYMSDPDKVGKVEGFAPPAKIAEAGGPGLASGDDPMSIDDNQN
ncbi:hypothetical protein HK405_010984 [Cladochytrium tenue]|nr:hypothetical protein HK405_010984 [Cladochytrium tenue]